LAGPQDRLLADDARAADLFHLPVGVGDDPVAREELHDAFALIGDRDRIGEEPLAVPGLDRSGMKRADTSTRIPEVTALEVDSVASLIVLPIPAEGAAL
jgi:hypothetical protein